MASTSPAIARSLSIEGDCPGLAVVLAFDPEGQEDGWSAWQGWPSVVTLADIAKECGMSLSTVSRAISNPDKVNSRTRDRIQRVARELGYVPNPIARSLSLGRTKTLGLVVPDIANPFFPPIIKAVHERARRTGNAVLLADTDEHASEESTLTRLMSKQVDGVIVASPRTDERGLAELLSFGPIVFINRRVRGAPSVIVDNAEGINQAVEHLDALGHRCICYLHGPRDSWSDRRRQQAMSAACRRHKIKLIEFGPFQPQIESGVRAGDLVQASRATAVIAYDDLIAIGVMARLAERGVYVGRDVSVIGIDDSPMSGMSYPTLTSIHVSNAEAGATAVDLLVRLLEGADECPVVELDTNLVVRASTGPAPSGAAGPPVASRPRS